MKQLLLVSVGGAIGAVLRWHLGALILQQAASPRFPVSTFCVNLVGCLVAGVLAGLATRDGYFSTDTRLFLFTGLLGGFTTFSAFGVETFDLLRRGEHAVAIAYATASVIGGVTALAAGFAVARRAIA